MATVNPLQRPVLAQNASGSLSATITDATGAVVPRAKVVLKDETTHAAWVNVSNSDGFFDFPAVAPGIYTLQVSAPGLQIFEEQGIVMNQGNTLALPKVVLQVATNTEKVEVVSGADVVVPLDTGQTSQTLNREMVEQLSIVGRDAAELMKIMPGMGMATGLGQNMWNSYTTASNIGPLGSFSANGTEPFGALTMTMDGANLMDPGCNCSQTGNINQNQVAEVTMLTSAYGAEFAKGPVVFQAIGKSGGSQFHGQAYLYARNGTLNAQDSFDKSQGIKPVGDTYYYPGGDLGGPVLIPGTHFNKNHDKLFFYAAYEYMDQHPQSSVLQYFLPTPQMLQGNFSPAYLASLGPNFANAHPDANVVPCGGGCNAGMSFPGGMLPQSLLDPNSLAYINTFPKPNADPATNLAGANYNYLFGPPVNRRELRLRGDYSFSDNTRIYFSWNRQREYDQYPISVWWWVPQSLPYPSQQPAIQKSEIYSANLVHTFSPTLTNELQFAEAAFLNPVKLSDPGAVNPNALHFSMKGLFNDPFSPQIPNVFGFNTAISGYFAPTYGEPWPAGGANAFGKYSQTPSFSDNLTKVWRTHTLKVGVYGDFARNNQTSGGYWGGPQGAADFENWGATSTSNPLADFILGRATQFFQSDGAPVADFKYYQYSFYVQDQWKTSRRLTLTLGLRFDHLGNWSPSSGPGLAVWDASTYDNTANAGPWTGLTWHARDPSIPMSGFPSRAFFYEPRFGVAYDLFGNGKTVLRGGAGVYRYQLSYNDVSGDAFNDPLNIPTLGTTWGCCVGWQNFSDFNPSLGTLGLGSGPNGILQKGDSRTPYTWTYNFTISQRLRWRSVAELQYSGNQSHDQMLYGPLSNIDLIPPGAFFKPDPKTGQVNDPASPSFPLNDYYPLGNYTGITLVGHGSYSYYNALILTWQKVTGRVLFTTNYTFSKVLGVRDGLYPYALAPNYGVLAWDHTQIFNAAYVVNLPGPVHGNKLFGGAVNSWIFSGITQMQSGAPLQPNTGETLGAQWPSNFNGQQYLGTNALGIVPMLTCDPRSGLSHGQYFNPSCFAPPTGGANGDFVWPYIHGPAFFNSDLAIYKDFKFKEHQKIELRFSAFNFLNHPLPQFGVGPDVSLSFIGPNDTLARTNQNTATTGKPLFDSPSVRRVVELAAKYNF